MKALSKHEISRLEEGLKDTGGYFSKCYSVAKRYFLSGYSLDVSINLARSKYGF